MTTLINQGAGGVSTGTSAAGTSDSDAIPADVPSAKQVLRNAAQSGAGRVRLDGDAGSASEVGALALLSGSSDTVSAEDIVLFDGLSGYAADGSPTWGELVTALGG